MSELTIILLLGLLQGVTEFLPISSSAHLILFPMLTGVSDQGISMDIAVHVGTLIAVMIYFRKDISRLAKGLYLSLAGKPSRYYSPLAINLVIASVPVALAGLLLHDWVAQARSMQLIAWTTVLYGVLLGLSDHFSKKTKRIQKMNRVNSFWIGCAQILALIPGTSRSGITLTVGLMQGFRRSAAARFSFLLSIPTILMAGSYEGYKALSTPMQFSSLQFLVAILVSFSSAYLCISLFMKWIQKIGVMPFVVYRVILGSVLLLYFV